MLDGMDSTAWLWPAGGFVAAAALLSTLVVAVISLRRMRRRGPDDPDRE